MKNYLLIRKLRVLAAKVGVNPRRRMTDDISRVAKVTGNVKIKEQGDSGTKEYFLSFDFNILSSVIKIDCPCMHGLPEACLNGKPAAIIQ
jgi:hypothetical protein